MTPSQLALLLVLLPLSAFAAVLVGVWACARTARWLERREAMDEHQASLVGAVPPAGVLGRAWGCLLETWWQSVAFGLQAAHALLPRRREAPSAAGGPPVLLVAGYLENAGIMRPLARRLRARGFQPVLVDLPSTLAPLADNVAFVAARAREVAAASGYARVGYVGHSMGGVIGRAAALADPDVPLATVVSIASPHRGTHLARFGLGMSARDMRIGSAHCHGHAPGRCAAVSVHTVVSLHDNIVSPAWSALLAEGDDVVLPLAVGHVAPLFLPGVAERVAAWLEVADFGVTSGALERVSTLGA